MIKICYYPFLLLVIVSCGVQGELSNADRDEIARSMDAYRQAWLANESAAVLSTLTEDVILLPPGGSKVSGKGVVKSFWFPSSDTVYLIRRYELSDSEISGSGNTAILTGISELSWDTVVQDSTVDTTSSRTRFISALKKIDGRWKISRQMWTVIN